MILTIAIRLALGAMMSKKIGVITLLLLAMGWSAFCRNAHAHAATTPPGPPLTADDAESWLDGYMPYALRTGDIAGAVVVIALRKLKD